ncbi:hypothetical protein OG896_24620 [Streptomyces sp. NBC_00669]|uniref:hypothetical protein n=1 Tax=Streptomyces sp. NBC_00669 TaxID=2976011 RepID=UPI002E371950|nr:hypothetical protein [Streptomyces sp. NBC_00669]
MLENEDCNVLKALAAVKYFCRAQPDVTERIKQVRKAWQRRVAESSTGEAGYWVTVDDSAGGTAHLDQVRLALAWIYGDVVHHDHERRQAADPFGLLERYRAAVPLVAFVMWFAIDVLSSVRELQDDGYLDLDPQVFDREVVLASTTWELPARAYAAPVGTPPPADIEAPFGAGWVELSRPPVPEDE